MNKTRMRYFEEEDVLHLLVAEGREILSLELSPNITVDRIKHWEFDVKHLASFSANLCVRLSELCGENRLNSRRDSFNAEAREEDAEFAEPVISLTK